MKINWKALLISSIIGLFFGIGFGYWMYDATLRLENPSGLLGIMVGMLLFCGVTVVVYIAIDNYKKKKK